MANLKLSTRLIIGFAAVVALAVILGIFSVTQLSRVNDSTVDIATNWLPSVRVVGQLHSSVGRQRRLVAFHVMSTTKEDMAKYERDLSEENATIAKLNSEYEPLISSPEERQLFQDYRKAWQSYLESYPKTIDLSRQNKNEEARESLRGNDKRTFDRDRDPEQKHSAQQ